MFSTCPLVRPSFHSFVRLFAVRYFGYTMFLKKNEPVLLQIDIRHTQNGANDQLLGSGGQRSRSHDAEVRHGRGNILHPFGRVSFLVFIFIARQHTDAQY